MHHVYRDPEKRFGAFMGEEGLGHGTAVHAAWSVAMTDPAPNRWDMLSLLLWTLFFACGLVPEPVFYALRDAAAVASHRAVVNSSLVITLSLSAYLALFVLRRCRESGASAVEAQGRALQAGVLGLLAFLEFPARGASFEVQTILELFVRFRELPGVYLQCVIIFVAIGKLAAWFYLYSLVLRFHGKAKRNVFADSPALFPSTRHRMPKPESTVPSPQSMQHTNVGPGPEDWSDETRQN